MACDDCGEFDVDCVGEMFVVVEFGYVIGEWVGEDDGGGEDRFGQRIVVGFVDVYEWGVVGVYGLGVHGVNGIVGRWFIE